MKCSASVVAFLVLLGASVFAEEPAVQEPVAAEQPKEMPSAALPSPKNPALIKAERQQRILELWSVMQQSGFTSETYRLAEAERAALIREQGAEFRREMKGLDEQSQLVLAAAQQKRIAKIEEIRRQQQVEEADQARKAAQFRAERAAKKARDFAKPPIDTPPSELRSTADEQNPITEFALRLACRDLIKKRLDDYWVDFQHADLESPYKDGRFTGWKSWFKRDGVKQWFICVHDDKTDYLSLVFDKNRR